MTPYTPCAREAGLAHPLSKLLPGGGATDPLLLSPPAAQGHAHGEVGLVFAHFSSCLVSIVQ